MINTTLASKDTNGNYNKELQYSHTETLNKSKVLNYTTEQSKYTNGNKVYTANPTRKGVRLDFSLESYKRSKSKNNLK